MDSAIERYNATLSDAERREAARRAGLASGRARAKYKTQRETLRQILSMRLTDRNAADMLEELGLDPTFATAVALAQVQAAAEKANTEAAKYVRDTVGEKPTDSYNIAVGKRDLSSVDMSELSDEELAAIIDGDEDTTDET